MMHKCNCECGCNYTSENDGVDKRCDACSIFGSHKRTRYLNRKELKREYLTEPRVHGHVNVERYKMQAALEKVKDVMAHDLSVYGVAYFEVVRAHTYIWLKPLDPTYIQERRINGELVGYIQTLTWPIITLKPEEILRVSIGQ